MSEPREQPDPTWSFERFRTWLVRQRGLPPKALVPQWTAENNVPLSIEKGQKDLAEARDREYYAIYDRVRELGFSSEDRSRLTCGCALVETPNPDPNRTQQTWINVCTGHQERLGLESRVLVSDGILLSKGPTA